MRVLFLGDIVGRAARHAVIEHMPQLRTELSDLQKEVARQGDKHEARMATATSVHRSLEARLAESQAQLEEAKKLIGALEREVAELREVAV